MRRSGSLKILEYSSLALPSLRSLATKINTLLIVVSPNIIAAVDNPDPAVCVADRNVHSSSCRPCSWNDTGHSR